VLSRLRALFSDSVVYGLSGVISRFIGIFLVPVYTRLFTPEDYGVLSLVASSLAVVSIFVGLGLDNSAHRWYWDTEDDADRRKTISSWAWCQLVTAAVFGLAVYASAEYLGQRVIGRRDAAIYFRIAAVTLPLTVLGTVANNWFRMQRRPWATTMYALGTNLVIVALTLLLVVAFRRGLWGVYAGQAVGFGIGSIVAAILLRDWIAPALVDFVRLRQMLRYALPLIPAGLAYWVTGFADRYFVQAYTNTAQVGLYSVGSSLAAGVALVTGAFQQAWGPFALSIHTQPDARRTYATVFLFYLWIAGIISAALSLFAPEILRLLATKQYAGASPVVGVLALSYVMIGLTYIAATGPAIAKRTGPTGIAMTAAAILNVILNFALVPRFGKVGSAVATLIAQSLTPIYLFYRSQQLWRIPYRFGAGAVLVIATLLVIAIGAQIASSSLAVAVLLKAGLLAFFVPLFFLLELATPRQVTGVLSRTMMRIRGAQA
jgi:O-antigen/teichoic acid export membrane protein